jgi:hypothetical protein
MASLDLERNIIVTGKWWNGKPYISTEVVLTYDAANP